MLICLPRAKRLLVGRLVALIYLVCVLAPGSALAFGNGHLSEHCLFDDGLAIAAAQRQGPDMHAASSSAGHHDQAAGPVHHHQHDTGTPVAENSASAAPPQHEHRTVDLQCCGMLCIAALPASISEVVTPSPTHAFALPETRGHLAGNLPLQHYRPPIV